MQAIELKRGLPISNLRSALAVFLETRYHRSPADFERDLDALESLRTDVVNVALVPEDLAKLIKYHNVLVQLGSKFPFDEDNVRSMFISDLD